jgi:biotin synthase
VRYSREQVRQIFERPFMDLVFEAARVHREHHDPNRVQWSTLLSVKTGACPEDCKYCSQSAHWNTKLKVEPLIKVDEVMEAAKAAKASGSTRFCMGAAWRRVNDRDLPQLTDMVREVKALGMETCMTLGTVSQEQAKALKVAGLDYYNHNLDTSREHYDEVITTRSYDERLETLSNVRAAGVKVCCGGIVGIGEEKADRIGLLWELANLPTPPESVPINQLVAIEGTPLEEADAVTGIELVRTIATARILMPTSDVRLSAGRTEMSDELQALCFLAGANSVFTGPRLLTTENPAVQADRVLFAQLGLEARG